MRDALSLGLFIILISPYSWLAGYYAKERLTNEVAQKPTGLYSFQIGAAAEGQTGYRRGFGIPITGARVEILIPNTQTDSGAQLSYWLGVDLSDQTVVLVGYLLNSTINKGQPSGFWAHSRAGARTSETQQIGSTFGKIGGWATFSLTLSGRTWIASVDNSEVGSVNIDTLDAGGPYAVAEISHAGSINMDLGPVEFRNLAYRDSNSDWHLAPAAVAICCYSFGSARVQGSSPYGERGVAGHDNHWIVGSHMPVVVEGQRLWPWYYAKVESDYGGTSGSGWYVKGNVVSPNAKTPVYQGAGMRKVIAGWLVNGRLTGGLTFLVETNLTLYAYYKSQFFLDSTSQLGVATGSGWYDKGSQALHATLTSPQPTLFPQCEWVFDGWHENGKQLSKSISSAIIMDAPHAVQAAWHIACHDCFFTSLCVAPVAFWYSSMSMITIVLFAIMLLFALRIGGGANRPTEGPTS